MLGWRGAPMVPRGLGSTCEQYLSLWTSGLDTALLEWMDMGTKVLMDQIAPSFSAQGERALC